MRNQQRWMHAAASGSVCWALLRKAAAVFSKEILSGNGKQRRMLHRPMLLRRMRLPLPCWLQVLQRSGRLYADVLPSETDGRHAWWYLLPAGVFLSAGSVYSLLRPYAGICLLRLLQRWSCHFCPVRRKEAQWDQIRVCGLWIRLRSCCR